MTEKERKLHEKHLETRKKWLEINGFSQEGVTYVYFPNDSFDVKATLKENGFRFNGNLFWHCATIPAGYEDKVIEIKLEEVAQMQAWGEGVYFAYAKKTVTDKMSAENAKNDTSMWIGEEKEKISDYPVTLVSVKGVETRYGYSQLVKFADEDDNEINWWTAVEIQAEVGSQVLLSGTVKKLDTYNGKKITVMTRCKIKEM